MKNYTYQNSLIGKKQLRQLLAWSFTNYDSMQACLLADELKYLGFRYASQAGISISIEDLKVPFVKNLMLERANQEIENSEKIFLKGKITEVERFQKIIDTWSLTSESLKTQIIYYFKNYDPLNSVYIMAFSGARGNLSQVRQLVGMRGLMSDPSGQIMNLPIKKNFREGLSVTDYLMSGYGARKGIVDTALKTANSGYLTRRLIDVAQDILIREKDCLVDYSLIFSLDSDNINEKIVGRILNKSIIDPQTSSIIAERNTQITPTLIQKFKEKGIMECPIRSPLTCRLYRAICQKCYGWDLTTENLIDIGEAIGILAGQSIGEPGTQLTMRTFHTGGIFTSETRQQIISPQNGIIQFYKDLQTVALRTNRGEDVLVTKNSGSLVLIPDNKNSELIKIDILRNTILFPKSNQYIYKDTVIGEVINTNKQVKTEIKTILSDKSGEIFIPKLKQKINTLNNNRLIWILEGQLYNSPIHSFVNFYSDYKLNKYGSIFRTKLVNHFDSILTFNNKKTSLYDNLVETRNQKYLLNKAKLRQLNTVINYKTHALVLGSLNYELCLRKKYFKNFVDLTRNEKFGTLITNKYKTLTGGTLHYNFQINNNNTFIPFYLNSKQLINRVLFQKRTLIWLDEEVHRIKCDKKGLLVEHGDFIGKGFEIIPDHFSKISGIVSINPSINSKNEKINIITIKSGLLYKSKRFKKTKRKVYFPGETLFSSLVLQNLSFCEYIGGKNNDQLLIRPIQLYEFALSSLGSKTVKQSINLTNQFNLKPIVIHSYKTNQHLKGKESLNLISDLLLFKTSKFLNQNNDISIELFNNNYKKCVEFNVIEKLNLNNYISANLKDKTLQSCIVAQKNQFLNSYSLLGYLEKYTLTAQEIVKFKVKKHTEKQIFLISNNECITVDKNAISNKTIGDIVLSKSNLSKTGRIIIKNDKLVTIQKGRPYFFPNCKNDNLSSKTNLQYKLFPQSSKDFSQNRNRNVYIDYSSLQQFSTKKNLNRINTSRSSKLEINLKSSFPKLFLKKAGKLYSCLMPPLSKKLALTDKDSSLNLKSMKLWPKNNINNLFNRTLLLKSSDLISNPNQRNFKDQLQSQLTLIKFINYSDPNHYKFTGKPFVSKKDLKRPFDKMTKAIGLYSITEDYFEQESNSVFCKNTEFIEPGKTLGLLNLEKEITGDIVQGLPRIEEILEARKKNLKVKQTATIQKKGLLSQKTSLDHNFDFRKIGTPIKENDKINPHKLVKAYFNYYGLLKLFLSDKRYNFKYAQLLNNYEACYKSFKKVQLFILDSVQSVYQSQGVTINDKHLEVIIKQMTTKVLVTSPGDTPLLKSEVIDLYHVQYMNQVLEIEEKQSACYMPLLLGITKAALNNPSFISAASFQETTRVLTKAGIEGRIDWLRGLKENIVIGHLIPAGTGFPNYKNCFKKSLTTNKLNVKNLKNFGQLPKKTRQID
uniref:RNA polymerase beta'' subunit n=1 Tax=Nitzschia ovalis TaxID=908985 RepID=UPI001EF9F5EF|nr:RNA polymerase beta'' subunit [Nitzschia ovalis]ULD15638.1 RNA polymerase beta'' subunit [Nitzschia ovalis]